ncbi:MAG: hypothetical protein M5U07_15450 [Xanthobacteraceae bacterium]|nr:hypothetical protein [Xanthobacteraceae bacterium]
MNDRVVPDLLGRLRLPVPFQIRMARVEKPRSVAELPSDERTVGQGSAAQRNIRLALGEVERTVRDQELEAKSRMHRTKAIEQRCQQMVDVGLRTRDPEHASDGLGACAQVPLQRCDALLDALGMRQKRLAGFGQAIAGGPTLDQASADLPFEGCQAALHRGLAGAEQLRRRERAAGACDGEEVAKIVPIEHCYSVLSACSPDMWLPSPTRGMHHRAVASDQQGSPPWTHASRPA